MAFVETDAVFVRSSLTKTVANSTAKLSFTPVKMSYHITTITASEIMDPNMALALAMAMAIALLSFGVAHSLKDFSTSIMH